MSSRIQRSFSHDLGPFPFHLKTHCAHTESKTSPMGAGALEALAFGGVGVVGEQILLAEPHSSELSWKLL